jgi:hypothetical protein
LTLDLFRVLVAAVLVMHGLSHILWFLAAWTSVRTGVGDGPWVLPGQVTIRSPIGKVLGLLALVVVVVFVAAAAMLLASDPGWREVANIGVFLSYGAVVPWLRQSPGSWGLTSVAANIVIMFLLALPLSVDIVA